MVADISGALCSGKIISRKELHKFMAKQKENAVVHSQEQLADGIYSMWINTEAAKDAKPGQFISMYTTDGSKLLPRPISICEIDKENGRLQT